MKHLTDSSLHGHILAFSMEIRTRSVNHGMHIIKAWLTLYSEVSLSLNGSVSFRKKKKTICILYNKIHHFTGKRSRKVIIYLIWIRIN